MNTSEQITALLHGELTDDRSVAELMHILSVSPERRAAFLEHIKVSRRLLRSGRSIAPPPAATENLLAKIAAMAPGAVAALPVESAPSTDAPAERTSDWKRWGLFLLLILSFTAGGYLLGSHSGASSNNDPKSFAAESAGAVASPSHSQTGTLLPQAAAVQQEKTGIEKEEKNMAPEKNRIAVAKSNSGADVNALHGRIAELTGLLERERKEKSLLQREVDRLHLEIIVLKEHIGSPTTPQNSAAASSLTALQNGSARELPLLTPAEAESNSRSGGTASTISAEGLPRPSSSTEKNLRPLRMELRQHLRSSLPDVRGLESGAGIFSDRELGITTEFEAMQRSIRFGVAVGGTSFAQVYHTNTGGALNDTIIEQRPNLIYGRIYAAPRIFEGERFSSGLEIGVGGTEIGPIGTAGLNLEYKLADRLTLQTGVASWLLWTSFRNQLHTSTNLNAHIGISVNP